MLHFFLQKHRDAHRLVGGRLNNQLIVYLQNQARAQLFTFEPPLNTNHRDFYNIRSGTLDWHVCRGTLGSRANNKITRFYIWRPAAAAK